MSLSMVYKTVTRLSTHENLFVRTVTLGGPIAPPQAASNFTGDVLVVTGSHDLVYCAGGCIRNGTNLPAEVQTLYPNAGSFETYIPA